MDLKQLLFSLLPLILIVIFSWLFSSRRSKQNGREDTNETFIFNDREEVIYEEAAEKNESFHPTMIPADGYQTENAGPEMLGHHKALYKGRMASQQMISPEPIKPKWWGA
jgi:hypothetical protein